MSKIAVFSKNFKNAQISANKELKESFDNLKGKKVCPIYIVAHTLMHDLV